MVTNRRSHSFPSLSEPEPLRPDDHEGAARVAADAFVDDPGWCAVGPTRKRSRWKWIGRICLGSFRIAERWGGPSWCIRENGEVVASLSGFAPGLWPPPRLRAARYLLGGSLLAGPMPLLRGLGAERIYERRHPQYDHFLVWMFTVSPAHQRRGLGRALMAEALDQADAARAPAYLWTANPDNLPYYRSHGFEPFAEEIIPGGVPNWFLERPAIETAT
jgi:GNAT superfamily N-acetyltransferase